MDILEGARLYIPDCSCELCEAAATHALKFQSTERGTIVYLCPGHFQYARDIFNAVFIGKLQVTIHANVSE